MATFPTPPNQPTALSPLVPLNSPMVGFASPFDHADGQNRDIILESIRAWASQNLLTWSGSWQTFFTGWIAAVDAYISGNAITGFSWRTTVTPLSTSAPTTVTIDPGTAILRLGDLVVDQTIYANYGIITALVDLTHAVVTYVGYLHGVAGPTVVPTDTAIATFVNTVGSLTKTALDAVYVAPIAYVPAPTGVYATDTANILAAVNKLPTGGPTPGGIVVLRAGQYTASLPDRANITYQGSNFVSTEIRATTGNLLNTAATRESINFEHITLSTSAGHLIELGGALTGIAHGHFTDVQLVSYAPSASLIHGTGSCQFLGYVMTDVTFTRPAAATVPAIDIVSSSGGVNANVFETCTLYGNANTTGPMIRLEATNSSYLHDNQFRNIVGENAPGGLIHLYSPSGVSFQGVASWDSTVNYSDHVVKIDVSATVGAQPRNIHARNVGTRFGTLAAGVAHFYINPAATPNGVVLQNIGDPNGQRVINTPATGRTIIDRRAISYRAAAVSYVVDPATDAAIISTGNSVNITLPTPNTVPVGTIYRVTNVNAAACSVSANGANLNGVTSYLQAQYVTKEWINDGTQWFA